MKLFHAPASPFARKVRVLIIELGITDQVELVVLDGVTPVANHRELNAHNPLGMIPVLECEDGSNLYDSPVICEYLNHLHHGTLFPTDTAPRFHALQLQALADGIMDLSVALRYELAMRPPAFQWADWIAHQQAKVNRGLDTLEQQAERFQTEPTIGELAVACALGYRDFRFSELDWRIGRPMLASWYQRILRRTSLATTIPA